MSKELKENLLNSLEKLKSKIIAGDYTEYQQEDIHETIEAYNDQKWDIDANLVKYLITGWATYNGGTPLARRSEDITPPLNIQNNNQRTGIGRGRGIYNIPSATRYREGKFFVGSVPKDLP